MKHLLLLIFNIKFCHYINSEDIKIDFNQFIIPDKHYTTIFKFFNYNLQNCDRQKNAIVIFSSYTQPKNFLV
jgi:hypothetical protein